MVKNLPTMWETWVRSLDWEDPLQQGMATHSSILAWSIPMDRGAPWTVVGGHKKLDMTERLSIAQHNEHSDLRPRDSASPRWQGGSWVNK